MHRALGPDVDVCCQWHQQDFISFVSKCTEDFDCILMSFAMHHSEHDGKAKLLQEGHRLLKARYLPCPHAHLKFSCVHVVPIAKPIGCTRPQGLCSMQEASSWSTTVQAQFVRVVHHCWDCILMCAAALGGKQEGGVPAGGCHPPGGGDPRGVPRARGG